MSLFKCADCGGKVSSEASACPHCGRPNPPASGTGKSISVGKPLKSGKQGLGCLFLFVVGTWVLMSIAGSMSKPTAPGTSLAQVSPAPRKTPAAPKAAKVKAKKTTAKKRGSTAGDTTAERIPVPTDPSAQYYLLEQSGTPDRPILTTMRIGKSGTSYSRREYDCAAGTFRYLGDGDTIEEMNASPADPIMAPLIEGSISEYVGRFACSSRTEGAAN